MVHESEGLILITPDNNGKVIPGLRVQAWKSVFEEHHLKLLQSRRAILVLFEMNLGPCHHKTDFNYIEDFHQFLYDNRIDYDLVLVLVWDFLYSKKYNDYCDKRGMIKRCNIPEFPINFDLPKYVNWNNYYWMLATKLTSDKGNDTDGHERIILEDFENSLDKFKSKFFLSFNNHEIKHRDDLFKIIIENNLIEKSFFSYLKLKSDTPKSQRIQESISIDESNGTGFLYLNSYCNITTETDVSDCGVYFSEKVFRPIINFQPFILVGNPLSLSILRKDGFKTFSPFIDESYDKEVDYNKRMKMIENEIIRIGGMSLNEIHDWFLGMVDILKHNRKLFEEMEIQTRENERYGFYFNKIIKEMQSKL